MTDDEYREFLAVLMRRYVEPRIPGMRLRHRHHIMEEWQYHLDQAERSGRVLRFIEDNCDEGEDVYRTFAVQRVAGAVADTRNSLDFSSRVMENAGFLDAFEPHAREILVGLRREHLPEADREVLRGMGSTDPEAQLYELVARARAYGERAERQSREVSVRQQLRLVSEEVERLHDEFQEFSTSTQPPGEPPKQCRRWFKGLGQIGQGAALSIMNVALAVGALPLPVSPETRTWGALASVATGIGTVLTGVGELRNE